MRLRYIFYAVIAFIIVRSTVDIVKANQYKPIIDKIKAKYPTLGAISPSLVLGFIDAESSFNPLAISSAGARGLMQLLPDTYSWILNMKGITPMGIHDPESNITAGMFYYKWILDQGYDGFTAIQMYNTGINGYKKGYRAVDYATKVSINSVKYMFV